MPRTRLTRRATPLAPTVLLLALGLPSPTAWALDDAGREAEHSEAQGGAIFASEVPPSDGVAGERCSFRHPVCVVSFKDTSATAAAFVMDAIDLTWTTMTDALQLPAPTESLGGPLLVYLRHASAARGYASLLERRPESRIDRASAFVVLTDGTPVGPDMRVEVARGVAAAALLTAAPATDPASVRSQSAYVAELVASEGGAADDSTGVFQSHPERSFTDTWPEATRVGQTFDDEARLFYRFLDTRYGMEPAGVLRGLWALETTTTGPLRPAWAVHPNLFDVLAISFHDELGTGSALEELIVEFAIARMSPRVAASGGALLLDVSTDVDIAWPTVARRFQSVRPVAPLGSLYAVIRREGPADSAGLRIEAEWEQHARMRFWLVKLSAAGAVIGRMPITALDRATEAQVSALDLRNAAAVVVVGVNLGDPFFRFEPQDPVSEPHGWLLTVAPL